jgi:endonuclease/exonuclease/phosphatase family metal-dependent hydrolase
MRQRAFESQRLLGWLLPAMVLSQGLQLLRVFIPSLAWYLRDTQGLASLSLLPYAFGTFLVGYAAVWVWRALGSPRALWLTGGGVALIRLAEQVSRSPAADLWLSLAGVAAFLLFLPVFLGHLRATADDPALRLSFGVVLGLGLDIALRGLFGTLDLSWVPGLLALSMAALQAGLTVWALRREPQPAPEALSEASWLRALPLLGIGPYLLLQLLSFQSQGWLETSADLNPPLGFVLVMLGNLLAAAGVAWGLARPATRHPLLAVAVGLYLVFTALPQEQPPGGAILGLLLGQLLMGWGWAVLSIAASTASRKGLGRTTVALASGMLLFLVLAFGYYLALDVALPFSRHLVPPAAAGLLGITLLLASLSARESGRPGWLDLTGLGAAAGLALVPLAMWVVQPPAPRPEPPGGLPVKVMTYNLHSGFSSAGRLDPEAIAQVIQASGADIVALQEVSRVRLLDGEADLVVWLSRRLGMPILFHGTEEPIWGNALLSRFPVLESGWGDLPREGTLIGRGYLWASIQVGGPAPLLLIATHLHHVESEGRVREAQVASLLAFWAGRSYSVLLGDLNALRDSLEMQRLAEAGLIDSWGQAGGGPGLTWPARDPYQRIDWIWHTADLSTLQVAVIDSLASDHRPVLVTLGE